MQYWLRGAILLAATAPFIGRAPWWQVFVAAFAGALLGRGAWSRLAGRPRIAAAVALTLGPGGLAVIVWLRLPHRTAAYLEEVDAVSAERVGERVRIRGYAAPGTLVRRDGVLELAVAERGKSLKVRYAGLVPDQLRDGMEVVAAGRLEAGGVLEADELLVRCPSNYDRSKGAKPF